jgi:hypothetical protein
MPLSVAPDAAIVCLRCALVTVRGLKDVHEAFHTWMENRDMDKITDMMQETVSIHHANAPHFYRDGSS